MLAWQNKVYYLVNIAHQRTIAKREGEGARTRGHLKRSDRREPKRPPRRAPRPNAWRRDGGGKGAGHIGGRPTSERKRGGRKDTEGHRTQPTTYLRLKDVMSYQKRTRVRKETVRRIIGGGHGGRGDEPTRPVEERRRRGAKRGAPRTFGRSGRAQKCPTCAPDGVGGRSEPSCIRALP